MKIGDTVFHGISISVYSFAIIDARMYVLRYENEVVIIDPHEDENLWTELNGAKRIIIILTHEHFDHISGVNWLRENYACEVYASYICAERIQAKRNGTEKFPFLFLGNKDSYHYVKKHFTFPYRCKVDYTFVKRTSLLWKNHHIQMVETPGHSKGSISVLVDRNMLFSGDSLLGNGQELRSIDSDPVNYMKKTFSFYECLAKREVIVFPGHGEIRELSWFLEKIRSYLWN